MISGETLRGVCHELYPELIETVAWNDTWSSPIETGKAFEWAIFIGLASKARCNGFDTFFPLLEHKEGPSMFILRNELPRHFVGKAGHAHKRINKANLAGRFLQALIPKLIISKDGRSFSVFREGCPYHSIMCEVAYKERPDILFLDGQPALDYPRAVSNNQFVEFAYELSRNFRLSGSLHVINAPLIPIEEKTPNEPTRIPIRGIIECSVNKTSVVAASQLNKYEAVFHSGQEPTMLLATGNLVDIVRWKTTQINLKNPKPSVLAKEILGASSLALRLFSIV